MYVSCKNHLTFILFFILLFGSIRAMQNTAIHPVDTLDSLEKEIDKLDEECLVVFDIDRVLGMQFFDYKKNKLVFSLLDKKIPEIIKKLQEKNIKTMALTATYAKYKQARVSDLKSIGIDFSETFSFSSNNFISGVLCSGIEPKGIALKRFLMAINFSPSRIIVIDDKIENIKSIFYTLPEADILGLHYIKAKPSDDKAIAEFQASYFKRRGIWLSAEVVVGHRETGDWELM